MQAAAAGPRYFDLSTDAAVLKEQNPVAIGQCKVWVVHRDQSAPSAALHHRPNLREYQMPVDKIERVVRFVQQHGRCILHDRPREDDKLFLSLAQMQEVASPQMCNRQLFKNAAHPFSVSFSRHPEQRKAGVASHQRDFLRPDRIDCAAALRHIADQPGAGFFPKGGAVDPAHPASPARKPVQPAERPEQGGFSRTVQPEQRNQFPLLQVQVRRPDDLPASVTGPDFFGLQQDWRVHSVSPLRISR